MSIDNIMPEDVQINKKENNELINPDLNEKQLDAVRKGDLAESNVILNLLEEGFNIYTPYTENVRSDLIIDNGKSLYKVQVKNGKYKNDCVVAKLARTSRGRTTYYTEDEIDYYAIYCDKFDNVYLVPFSHAANSAIYLRVDEPKKNDPNINWAKDYLL